MYNLKGAFYLGQNEDCGLGDSTSDSSEKLLQSGEAAREFNIYVILMKGKYISLSTYKFFAEGFC